MASTKIREIPTRPPTEAATNEETAASSSSSQLQEQGGAPESSLAAAPQITRPGPEGSESRPAATEEKIRELAYFKWQTAGSPPGDGVEFWVEAENELANVQQRED